MKPTQKQKEENDRRAAEYASKVEEYEESQQAKGKIFDPLKLLERASKLHTVDHPVLGQLQYGELTFRDAFEINKCETDTEKTETIAWLMLRKAYPELPKDFLTRMPLIESAALVDFLVKQPSFLSIAKTSRSGSRITRRRRR